MALNIALVGQIYRRDPNLLWSAALIPLKYLAEIHLIQPTL